MTRQPATLSFDIGGSSIKAAVVAPDGTLQGALVVHATPRPAVPDGVLLVLTQLASGLAFERVSVGFPGVVVDGITLSAPNLDGGWVGFPLADELGRRLGRSVKVANDADLAGLALIEGRGVEMVITLGTGMGAGLYLDGRLVPNLELGHHPFGDGRSYEERVSDRELAVIGTERWKVRVLETIAQIRAVWNFRRLHLGGGNARLFQPSELPADVALADNRAGVLGGACLYRESSTPRA
ncbi:MAG: ROK family protein [Myxococcales bacterium]|nr:ROK family protein [Myxococcales bacterium]